MGREDESGGWPCHGWEPRLVLGSGRRGMMGRGFESMGGGGGAGCDDGDNDASCCCCVCPGPPWRADWMAWALKKPAFMSCW